MKNIALIIVALGVGLAAASGARNADPVTQQDNLNGLTSRYCKAPADLSAARAKQVANGCDESAWDGVDAVPVADVSALEVQWVEANATFKAHGFANDTVPAGTRLSGWWDKSGILFVLGLAMILGGAMLFRRGNASETAGGTDAGPKFVDMGDMLTRITSELKVLETNMVQTSTPTTGDVDYVKETIDGVLNGPMAAIIDARDQLVQRYGMAGFAEVFGPFAGGERNLNRAWSSVVDSHWPESTAAIGNAVAGLEGAKAALDQLASARKG